MKAAIPIWEQTARVECGVPGRMAVGSMLPGWLGEALSPEFALGAGTAVLLVEQAPPDLAADPVSWWPGQGNRSSCAFPRRDSALLENTPTRFLDLLDLVEMRGVVRDVPALASAGSIPAPAPGALIPGGLVASGKGIATCAPGSLSRQRGAGSGMWPSGLGAGGGTPLELTARGTAPVAETPRRATSPGSG